MLASTLKFYKNDLLINEVDSIEYDHLSESELKDFIQSTAKEYDADKVSEVAFYHNHHSGIESIVFEKSN